MFRLLSPLFVCCYLFAGAQVPPPTIHVNQVGFYTDAAKLAVVTGSPSSDSFYIIGSDGSNSFSGRLSSARSSAYSSLITRHADFTKLKTPGVYRVSVPGVGESAAFRIGKNVHHDVAVAVIKGYYYQRVSMPLTKNFAGKWERPAGHPDTAVLIHSSAATSQRPAGTKVASAGGWYDAGDYNKYIVNSGITMGTLLSAYEDFPDWFKKLEANIPESGNGVPDILDEIIYNLRWMLTMQDPQDGGVYNKCTNASFDGMVMPGVTTAPRYLVQKGTAATLDFAAVTAQAARILLTFKKQYPGLADSCRLAALSAWDWSIKNPLLEYNQGLMNKSHQPEIVTGGYGDRNFNDERAWAAAELFILTKERKYFDTLSAKTRSWVLLPSWANVEMLGYYSMLRHSSSLPAYTRPLTDKMKSLIVALADSYIVKTKTNAFGTVMGQTAGDYNWGGNANAANQGILLLNAFRLTANKTYADHALTNLDYLLGRNATGYCFVTGTGTRSPMFPHHRQSAADTITEPVPGLLVGGPNKGMQDKCEYPFKEVETAYTDRWCSYASNEIAINWNAPIVYLANAMEALQLKLGYSR